MFKQDKKKKKDNDHEICRHEKVVINKPKLDLQFCIERYIQAINEPSEIINKDEFLVSFRNSRIRP